MNKSRKNEKVKRKQKKRQKNQQFPHYRFYNKGAVRKKANNSIHIWHQAWDPLHPTTSVYTLCGIITVGKYHWDDQAQVPLCHIPWNTSRDGDPSCANALPLFWRRNWRRNLPWFAFLVLLKSQLRAYALLAGARNLLLDWEMDFRAALMGYSTRGRSGHGKPRCEHKYHSVCWTAEQPNRNCKSLCFMYIYIHIYLQQVSYLNKVFTSLLIIFPVINYNVQPIN